MKKQLYTEKSNNNFFENNSLVNKNIDITNLLIAIGVLVISSVTLHTFFVVGIINFIFFMINISGCAHALLPYMYPSTKITNQPLRSIITGHVYTYHVSAISDMTIHGLYNIKYENKYFYSTEYFLGIISFIIIGIMGEKWFMSRITR